MKTVSVQRINEIPQENKKQIRNNLDLSNDNGNINISLWIQLSKLNLYINPDLVESAKDIYEHINIQGYFLYFHNSIGFLRIENKSEVVVFHKQNLEKFTRNSNIYNEPILGEFLQGYCYELEKKVHILGFDVTHSAIFLYKWNTCSDDECIVKKWKLNDEWTVENWKLNVQRLIEIVPLTTDNPPHCVTAQMQEKYKRSQVPNNEVLSIPANITFPITISGRIKRIMQRSILIEFQSRFIGPSKAIAQCPIYLVYVDPIEFSDGIIQPWHHGIIVYACIEILPYTRNVQGFEVNYEAAFAWTRKKPAYQEVVNQFHWARVSQTTNTKLNITTYKGNKKYGITNKLSKPVNANISFPNSHKSHILKSISRKTNNNDNVEYKMPDSTKNNASFSSEEDYDHKISSSDFLFWAPTVDSDEDIEIVTV